MARAVIRRTAKRLEKPPGDPFPGGFFCLSRKKPLAALHKIWYSDSGAVRAGVRPLRGGSRMREAVPPWEVPAAGTRAGGGRVTRRAHFGKPSETMGRKAMGTKAFSDKGGNGDEDPNPREDAKSARLLDHGKPLETMGRKARGLTARRPRRMETK